MTAVLLAGTAPAPVLDAVRAGLEPLGASVTGPDDTDAALRAIVTGEAAFAAAIVLTQHRLGEDARRDAYVLWQLGVPVVFAIAGDDTAALAAECEGFAAGLGQAGAPCVPLAPGPIAELVAQLPSGGAAPTVAPAVRAPNTPPADQIRATVAWSGAEPLLRGRSYTLHSDGRELTATVAPIKHRLDLATLEPAPATHLAAGEVGDCDLELDGPIATDAFRSGGGPGAFVLGDRLTGEPAGIGIVRFGLRRAANLSWQAVTVDAAARAIALGQTPCVLWLTGLSGAGKSTIADRVESALHARGHRTYLLDGDNVRHGLNRDLGFTDADRVENIRRVAEVARLMTDAGLIVLVSFISPFASERAMARGLFAPGTFHEIYVDTPLAVAEARDPKGLYAKARAGRLRNFTGIDSPYEPPEKPELRIDTTALDADEAVAAVLALLERQGVLRPPGAAAV